MWWRLKRSEFDAHRGERNKRAFRRIVQSGAAPGVLAYAGGKPVGWCAIAPRKEYPVLARSRVLAPVDDEPVWSVTCFFIARGWRRNGLSSQLLGTAVEFARRRGAKIVEGYPHDVSQDMADAFVYTGLASAFCKVGFKEVARRSAKRPIMRKKVSS